MTTVRRYLLVRLYLAWHAAVGFGFGLELLFAPRRLITGPSVRAIYAIADPPVWGAVFVLLGVACLIGWARPLVWWRLSIFALGLAQILWALGLFAPLFTDGRTNLLASLPWIALAATTGIVAVETIHEEHRPGA